MLTCLWSAFLLSKLLGRVQQLVLPQAYDRRRLARNVAIKAAVVSADERESGEREHLKFGHTIGHAIKNLVGYGASRTGRPSRWGWWPPAAWPSARPHRTRRRHPREEAPRQVGLGRWPGLSAPPFGKSCSTTRRPARERSARSCPSAWVRSSPLTTSRNRPSLLRPWSTCSAEGER